MTTPTMPSGYFDRFDPAKNYEKHLFIAGRGSQSAEMNEIQDRVASRLKGVADALFKDGDIVRDAGCIVDQSTGAVTCQAGAIYLVGAVRGVAPASLTVPVTGTYAIGIRMVSTVVTALEDPTLRDPAPGTRNFDEEGADRLQVVPTWAIGTAGDTDFYPVYSVTDAVLDAKEAPPSLDAVSAALARYDRDSAGGSYVVAGLTLKALADAGGNQVYSLAEGRCRVYGYPFEFPTARRLNFAAAPDLKSITNEPHLSATASAQRINFDRTPGTGISQVSITAEKTVTLTHGVSTGAQDPLPDTSVLSILEVKQGATTYTATTDYLLTSGKCDWSPAGAEPAPGSTYTVKYRYITTVTPTAVDDTGFTVEGAVSGTLVLVTYNQKLPRYDRLCIDSDGNPVWLTGVAAEYNQQLPSVPADMLAIATVYQTWTASRTVTNDGVRVVPMPQLAAVEGRMDWLAQLIAQGRLESSIHTREGGTKKGLFTDPFIDDSQRDAGTAQTAAIVRGELQLPIVGTAAYVGADILAPQTLGHTHVTALAQTKRTGSMKINPYMAFAPASAAMKLTPAVDRWTDIVTTWASPNALRIIFWQQGSATPANTRDALLSTSSAPAQNLRQISVAYQATGFGAGEALASLTFDGVSISTGGAVANSSGVVSGSFTIPANIPSGTKAVVAVGASGSRCETTFTGQGTITQRIMQRQTTAAVTMPGTDPLAQTFTQEKNGQFTGLDLWFSAAPTSRTSVQIRSTASGLPGQEVLAEAILEVGDISVGGVSTRALFPCPVTLLGGSEYAIVVLCNDAIGALSVAELGKFDATAQQWITSQPYTVGVLLSSSNASTWTAHQDRDLAFRLLKANYSEAERTIALGNVAVTNTTDLMLLSYAERPDSSTGVQYHLTLPDASVLTVDDGQRVQLAAAITGNVSVSAVLSGSADFSPVFYPGTQLVPGVLGTSGTYVTRAIPAGSGVRVKTIFEAVIPSGANVVVEYKGPDAGDNWAAVPAVSNRAVDDGFTEFINEITPVTEATVQIRLTLTGSTAARPRVRDLRCIVI